MKTTLIAVVMIGTLNTLTLMTPTVGSVLSGRMTRGRYIVNVAARVAMFAALSYFGL